MRKLLVICCLITTIFSLTGCGNKEKVENNNKFITAKANDEGKIVIDKENVTQDATFVNYEVDGVTIQFVVVRGTDGKVRIAFNTCGSCNPSSNAYFVQKGEYLECQNCGNRFHIDKIGEEKLGCNPVPVEETEETDSQIIIDKAYVDSYKTKFENWNGPTK